MARGKGNKIISLNPGSNQSETETLKNIVILPANAALRIHAGRRHLTLKKDSLNDYFSNRGRRGKMLPRGLQKADRIEVIKESNQE